jgi:hypothetical protein
MKIVEYIGHLPDVYQKGETSNNYKLLLLEQKSVEALYKDIEGTWEMLDIYSATGETLDLYGEMYDQPRGKATDEQYRYLIAQKVAQNMVEGDYNSIVNSIAVAFDVPPTKFKFVETAPAEVECSDLPYEVLLNAGITVEQAIAIIEAILPVGVTLAPMELTGTFEFGVADEYDEGKGFGNIDQTIGGYFGYLASKE